MTLTPTEDRILRLKASGIITNELAGQLGVSPQTVKNHLISVYRKLDVTNLVEAMNAMGWVHVSNGAETARQEPGSTVSTVHR